MRFQQILTCVIPAPHLFGSVAVEPSSMAISDRFVAGDAETPLLESAIVNAAVNSKGQPASRRSTGCWRSASFIIGVSERA